MEYFGTKGYLRTWRSLPKTLIGYNTYLGGSPALKHPTSTVIIRRCDCIFVNRSVRLQLQRAFSASTEVLLSHHSQFDCPHTSQQNRVGEAPKRLVGQYGCSLSTLSLLRCGDVIARCRYRGSRTGKWYLNRSVNTTSPSEVVAKTHLLSHSSPSHAVGQRF